ncbi:hypothetical protein Esti_005294 [Eimeria stiedai]
MRLLHGGGFMRLVRAAPRESGLQFDEVRFRAIAQTTALIGAQKMSVDASAVAPYIVTPSSVSTFQLSDVAEAPCLVMLRVWMDDDSFLPALKQPSKK